MKNNIAIFNHCWERVNYGGVLTAYALHKIIQEHGNINSLLVDNSPIKFLLNHVFDNHFIKFKKTYCKFIKIKTKYLNFFDLNCFSSIFFTGSDQVFRVKYTDLDEQSFQYFLDFVEPDNKKIAFAASFGVDKEQFISETTPERIEDIKLSLKSFDFISVREKSGVAICKDLFDVDAEWIIDPVFILDKSNYENLIKDSTKDYSNKIVSYVLDDGEDYDIAYKYLENKYNSEVIKVANTKTSIENWLSAIKSCKLFVTDSFHGMCFAMIFNKPFICLANKSRGRARFESILEMLGVENQCLDSILEVLDKDCVFKIDYEKVNQNIEKERQRGLDFLKRALEAEPIKYDEKKIVYERCVAEMKAEKKKHLKHIKEFFWLCWLFIFHNLLPESAKNKIRELRDRKRGNN